MIQTRPSLRRFKDGLCLSDGLQLVAQCSVVTPLQAALFALPFTRLDQVFQAARAFCRRLAALGAPFIPLHAQLILALARDRHAGELVLYSGSHRFLSLARNHWKCITALHVLALTNNLVARSATTVTVFCNKN